MPEPNGDALSVSGLIAGYGKKQVLNGVGLNVAPGEIVAIIGHNGAGKSTLLKAIFGLIRKSRGDISIDGSVVEAPSPRLLLERGVAYVPQGNCVFAELTIRENLEMGATTLADKKLLERRLESICVLFPVLQDRLRQRAGVLSGGERQVLALANALVLEPRLLLLDEPSLGLAPPLVADALNHIAQLSHRNGVAVLIVEQKVREVLKIADRVYAIRAGLMTFNGGANELKDEKKLREVYL